jgi:hypothetical protein
MLVTLCVVETISFNSEYRIEIKTVLKNTNSDRYMSCSIKIILQITIIHWLIRHNYISVISKLSHIKFSVYVKIMTYANLQMLNSSYQSIHLAYIIIIIIIIIIHLLKFPTSLTGIHLKNESIRHRTLTHATQQLQIISTCN